MHIHSYLVNNLNNWQLDIILTFIQIIIIYYYL